MKFGTASVCILAAAALAVAAFAASTYQAPDDSFAATAPVMEVRTAPDGRVDRISTKGSTHIRFTNKAANTEVVADASGIVATFLSPDPKAKKTTFDLVKAADFAGPVKLVYTAAPAGGVATKTTATADSATYNGQSKMAYLKGNVKIVHEDPATFEQPTVLTGDRATINLNRNLGPENFRFRVESSPGVSRIEVTPKPKEEAPKSK